MENWSRKLKAGEQILPEVKIQGGILHLLPLLFITALMLQNKRT